ncbi:uncharacterized protein LOC124788469 [Schistocerca piceifrons]|uniref:uncharacterized protein LOC124788469 n=1 Tax=Schistocerca piceifrons TaxID=274613 RepID=UPI001F5F253C|nr:uncharacterized protein LOC124788469 [Schistocerca piceifrons]
MASKDSSKRKQAIEEEMTSLKKNKTWDLVPLPHNRKASGYDTDVYLEFYVDDGLLICKSPKILENILTALGSMFEITVGNGKYFFGLEIKHSPSTKEICIGQERYINCLLQKFNMDNSKPNSTPFDVGTMLHSGQSTANQHERTMDLSIRYKADSTGLVVYSDATLLVTATPIGQQQAMRACQQVGL